jgi:integrase
LRTGDHLTGIGGVVTADDGHRSQAAVDLAQCAVSGSGGTGDDDEIRMLTKDEFARLLAATEEYWRPLMEFLVVSGCRWGASP